MPSTYESIVIKAPLDVVWSRIRDFHDCSFAPRVLPDCEKVGDKGGTEVGAKRILNGVFHETLTHHDERSHAISYSIDDGPSPVSAEEIRHYVGSVRLRPITEGGGTFAEWSSRWEADGDAAVAFCSEIDRALLRGLAASCE